MQRVSRLKLVILATIACAILFCIAAFSVSWAQWDGGDDDLAVQVSGASDLFYIEYPQYISEGGSSAPALTAGKYYMQVPRRTNPSISDYYQLKDHTTSGEKKLESVYLYAGDVLSMYYGTTPQSISNHNGGDSTCGAASTNNLTLSGGKYTVNSEGFYDFYYVYGDQSFWVNYIGKPSEGSGTTTPTTPERDTSKHSVKVKFTNTTIVFQLDPVIIGYDTYFYIVNASNEGTPKPGLKMSTGSDVAYTSGADIKNCNTIQLGFSSGSVDKIILYAADGSTNYNDAANKHTGNGDSFFKALFNKTLKSNYTYTIKANNVYWNDLSYGNSISEDTLKSKFSVSGTSGGGSATNPADSRTKVKPTLNGSTSFNAGATVSPNEEVVEVRKMDATMTKLADDRYEYHNYICVSRQNSDDAADDNSIAVLQFDIKGKGSTSTASLANIPVSSITITRRDTDEEGNPLDGYIDPAPRVYNYDITNSMSLLQIGHGDLHESFDDVDAQGKDTTNMIAHYDNGIYVILYFADNKQQYFALDLSIETTQSAEFVLTASVNNTNMWDRYKQGFGEEWGYYLGGLINEVWLWNPTRTTKFEASSGTVLYDRDAELDALGMKAVKTANASGNTPEQYKIVDKTYTSREWKDISDRETRISNFNNNNNFNYNIVDYSQDGTYLDESGFPMWARYTQDYVDVSLTINLTAGSKVKLCMLDWSGQRGDLKDDNIKRPTTYYLPNTTISSPEDLFDGAANYDKDLNFIVPKTGEYSFRFVGYVHDFSGKYIRLQDGTVSDSGGTGYVSIPNYNFIIDTLYISRAKVVGKALTVTFDANGGTFADGEENPTQLVRFGNGVDLTKAPTPTHSDTSKVFGGWQYKDDSNNYVDYKRGAPVLDDMTLYAKWVGREYTITFKGNGGLWGASSTKTITAGTDGKIAAADLATFTKPTRSMYEFAGWKYDDGTVITHEALGSAVFTTNTTLTAQWTQQFTVTFNTDGGSSVDPQIITSGGKVTEPSTAPTKSGWLFDGWYKDSGKTTLWNFATDTVTADTTIYAKWKAGFVTGTYYLVGMIDGVNHWSSTLPDYKIGASSGNVTVHMNANEEFKLAYVESDGTTDWSTSINASKLNGTNWAEDAGGNDHNVRVKYSGKYKISLGSGKITVELLEIDNVDTVTDSRVKVTFSGSTHTAYIIADSTGDFTSLAAWIWNGSTNYTGGNWPGRYFSTTMSTTSTATNLPTGSSVSIIINNQNNGAETATKTFKLDSDRKTVNSYKIIDAKGSGKYFKFFVVGATVT